VVYSDLRLGAARTLGEQAF